MSNIGSVFTLKSGQLKTMCAGQPQSRSQREFQRLSLENPLSRRLIVLAGVFSALALSPAVTRADFIGDARLNQALSSSSMLGGQVTAFGDDSFLFDVFSGRIGSGSSVGERDSAPADAPRHNEEQPSTPSALAGIATGGCGSTSGSAPVGGSAGPVGIVNEVAAPVAETCSGRIMAYVPLSLPSPLAERLLDPPRNVA